MTGTDLSHVDVEPRLGAAVGDGQADNVTVNGTNGADVITVNAIAGART